MAPSGKRTRDESADDYCYVSTEESSDDELDSRPTKKTRLTANISGSTRRLRRSDRIMKKENDADIARQQREAHNRASRFFMLPGELRNTIYEMCTEQQEVAFTHDLQHADEISWDGNAAGRTLTQACRMLRVEFLPLYKRSLLAKVPLDDVPSYLNTWLSDRHGPVNGRLVIALTRSSPTAIEDTVLDITRLIQLRRDHSEFDFFIEGKPDQPPVQRADNALPPKVDLRYFEEDMEQITMSFSSELDLDFEFHIKRGREVGWFDEDKMMTFEKASDLHYWARELMGYENYERFVSFCNLRYYRPGE